MVVSQKTNLGSLTESLFINFKQIFSAENVANFSLICIFPLLFIYQFLVSQFSDHIKPIFGGGWAITIVVLFFCLAYFYAKKFFLQRNEFFFLDYCFVIFLIFVFSITLLHYFAPLKAQYNVHLLHWNLSGVVSNATCYMAFRLSKISKPPFLRIWVALTFLIFLAVAYNMIDINAPFFINENFIFGFKRIENSWGYQGFARSLLFTILISIFLVPNFLFAVSIYVLGTLVLIANQSRTELILFVFSIPAILVIFNSHKNRIKILFTISILFLLISVMFAFVPGLFSIFIKIFSNTRIASLFDLWNDPSFLIRIEQSSAALHSIFENPLFGDYGEYYLETGLAGNYSHNVLGVWVNFGLIGFLFYCGMMGFILNFIFTTKLYIEDRVQIYIAGALGGSAIVAHLFSYTYVDVLLACAAGAVANAESNRKAVQKN